MKRTVATVAWLACVLPAPADSIWQRRDPRAAFLFQDLRAREVGDLLTVAINETTNANEREKRAMDKSAGVKGSGGFSGGVSAGSLDGDASLDLSVTNGIGRTFDGNAQLSSDRRFVDWMTVTVVDVLPNGNLVIEGTRSREVAGELRWLRITGMVRPVDIGVNNTVESRYIAGFKVAYFGRGPQSSYINQGIVGRAMNWIWP